MTLYIAKSAVVKVPVGSATGNRIARFISRGGVIPEGVDQSVLDGLERRGLIERLDEPAEVLLGEIPADQEQGATVGAVVTSDGQEHVGEIPAAALVDGAPQPAEEPDEYPTPAWNHEQINAWAARQQPPIEFETDANKATKLALIEKLRTERQTA